MQLTNRRDLLRGFAACGAYALGNNRLLAAFAPTPTPVPPVLANRLLVIFLRGGNDGINTIVPWGDTSYPTVRPVINLGASTLLGLQGSSFAKAHPALQPVLGANSPDELGRIAWLHQVGNPECTRSHFYEMDVWEAADVPGPNQSLNPEGMIARLAGWQNWPGVLPAAGLAAFFRMFHAPASLTTSKILGAIRDVDNYDLSDLTGPVAVPGPIDAPLASLLGPFLAAGGFTGAAADVAKYGDFAFKSMSTVASLPPLAAFNSNGITGGENLLFLDQARDAMRLLMHVPQCRVVGVNFGGFDTHADQLVRHDMLLKTLANGLRGIHDASVAAGTEFDDSMLTLVISEFGRTAKDNGSGTDHGYGNASIAMGRRVIGGVRNCDSGTWSDGLLGIQGAKLTGKDMNALPVRTDFRAVYAEVLQKWFAVPPNRLFKVLPDLADPVPPVLTQLGFLP